MLPKQMLIKKVRYLILFLAISITSPIIASPIDEKINNSSLISYANNSNTQKTLSTRKNYEPVDSWVPYYTWIGNVQNLNSRPFIQKTIGIAFLYFQNVKGNLTPLPRTPSSAMEGYDFIPGIGSISYNRVAIFEWMFGYRIYDWLKIICSLQNQKNLAIQSASILATPIAATVDMDAVWGQLRANISLNSILLKINFELPWPMILKSIMFTPYATLGAGPSWISLTDIRNYINVSDGIAGDTYNSSSYVIPLRQKYSANAAWQADLGFRIKAANPLVRLSFLLGCKYNQWGKIRNVGLLQEQGPSEDSLWKPFEVGSLYSFAPYVGIHFNF